MSSLGCKAIFAISFSLLALAYGAVDSDGDGLEDAVETNTGVFVSPTNTGTDPNVADTDGDGLGDGVETRTGFFVSSTNTGTDPNKFDSDNDGLRDGVETGTGAFVSATNTGTDPNKFDSDNDGLRDGVETRTVFFVSATNTGTDPNKFDSDNDGLRDGVETRTGVFVSALDTGTDPNKSDTEQDGMPDGWEVRYSLGPLVKDAEHDVDSDGLTNLREFRIATDPRDGDSDNDGVADGPEVHTYFTDPLLADTDNDGWTDGDEVARNADPLFFTTPATAPQLVEVGAVGNTGDPAHGNRGSVGSGYRIGVFEVTVGDYVKFLNAVAGDSDPHGLYDERMAYAARDDLSDPWTNTLVTGGIAKTSSGSRMVYSPKPGFDRKPVNFVSYDSALRYCNWLHDRGETNSVTESGAYSLAGSKTRGAAARYWIPNENEWYKAAAYDLQAGPAYWAYASRSNIARSYQIAVRASTGLVDVDKVTDINGTYAAPPSHFGTFGQSGNAAEWIEKTNAATAGVRGGSILSTTYPDTGGDVSTRTVFEPSTGLAGRFDIGFRIASVVPSRVSVPKTFDASYPGVRIGSSVFGRPVLLEYFHGGSAASPPAVTNYPAQAIIGGELSYTFVARTDDPVLIFRVETTTNLRGPWTTNGLTALPPQAISSSLVRLAYRAPLAGDGARFFRLVVDR